MSLTAKSKVFFQLAAGLLVQIYFSQFLAAASCIQAFLWVGTVAQNWNSAIFGRIFRLNMISEGEDSEGEKVEIFKSNIITPLLYYT